MGRKILKKVEQDVAIERRELVRWLPVKLDRDTLLQRAQTMAQHQKEKSDIEADKARVTREFGEKLKAVCGELTRLSDIVRTSKEHCNVQCEEVKNFGSRRVRIVRKDTGEVVEEREMFNEEAQRSLDVDAEPSQVEVVEENSELF